MKKRSNAGVQNLNVCSCIVSVFLRVLFVIANVSVINVGIMCSLNRKGRGNENNGLLGWMKEKK